MAQDDVRISEAELQLLQLLWDESPLGAADIAKRVPKERSWSLTTVKTLLARMVIKGAVEAEAEGRRHLYRPAIARETVAARQAGGLIDRLFGGRVSPLVAQLAEEGQLSSEDLDELEALVRSLRP
ncbi:MAG TPA: BlaI/MecI/CopY family transcriptional regulator [Sphingomicrobium sp.]|jgi:predicted transcriptional regulator